MLFFLNFYSSMNIEKKYHGSKKKKKKSSTTVSTMMDHVTEAWSDDAENAALHHKKII